MRHEEIIEKILHYHPAIENYVGCDGYKAGNPKDHCTGIVSVLVPTLEAIQKTAALGCNLMVTHEPIYYQTPDFSVWKGGFPNAVQQEKQALLQKYGITVWRDHDHIHTHQPDGIFTGVVQELGWQDFYQPELAGGLPFFYPIKLPQTTVAELGRFLAEKLSLNGLRYIGNPTDTLESVALVAHLYPGAAGPEGVDEKGHYRDYAMAIMERMEQGGIQAIIPGEVVEWTALSYIRDAVALGKAKACFNIGHFSLEELGMRHVAGWLAELVGQALPVHYLPTGDIYQYL